MPFPYDVVEDFETFFEPTRIWLFGKHFDSLTYNRASMDGEFADYRPVADPDGQLRMPPRRIERTLRKQSHRTGAPANPIFARIYSFTFEAHYYKLARPLLFLVHGEGNTVSKSTIARPQVPLDQAAKKKGAAPSPPAGDPPQSVDPATGHAAFSA